MEINRVRDREWDRKMSDVGENVSDLKIAVDGFRNTDYLDAVIVEKFRENRCVGIGIISADNHDCVQLVVFRGFFDCRKLFIRFDFGPV